MTAARTHYAASVLARARALLTGIPAPLPASSLAGILRRVSDRIFAADDQEARSRGWQITRCRAGFGREYRDPRFGTLARCPECGGDGSAGTGVPCAACSGTGRVTTGFPSGLRGGRPV